MSWHQAENILIPLQLLLAMLGMGATLGLKEFLQVMRHPAGVGIGLGLQWIAVPLLGLLWGQLFALAPGWALGLVLVAVTPGGAFSNLLTFIARGHVPLSISVTLMATLSCVFTAPLLLRLMAAGCVPASFVFPVRPIIFEVTLYLLLPLALGMATYRYLRRYAATLSKLAIWTSLTLVLVIAGGALTTGRIEVAAFGWRPPLQILAFALVNHLLAAEVCHLLGRTDDETVALSIEVSVRNGGVGLLLLQFFFTGQPEQNHALYTILLYTGLQVWVPVPAIIRHRLGRSPLWLRAPRRAHQ